MNAFVTAIKAKTGSASYNVDFFYKAGAMRGKDIVPVFQRAYEEDAELALRNAQWLRDVRGGAGERKLFRDILAWLEKKNPADAIRLVGKVPLVGRWDDVFVVSNKEVKTAAFNMLGDALRARDGLAAKWTPRQGPLAAEIRQHFGMSPKFYRKSLVELTNVVEQKMCAKEWDEINFSHVPSVAAARYKKAFGKNAPTTYAEYVAALVKGDNPEVKINASAIFPHEVLKGALSGSMWGVSEQQKAVMKAQWEALPNYMESGSVIPVVDVSGSMSTPVGGYNSGSSVTCMDISVALGLYCADKNKGAFNGAFLTFSSNSTIQHLTGDIFDKIGQLHRANWGMTTSIEAAYNEILRVAKSRNVPKEDMPKIILIMSDMQFNGAVTNKGAMAAAEYMFRSAGYEAPKVVFWNLSDSGAVPVAFDKTGAALVSGFSPSIVKPVLAADFDNFTPEAIMKKALMVERYDI